MAIREKKYEGETLYVCDRPGCPFDTFEKDRAEAHKDEPHHAPKPRQTLTGEPAKAEKKAKGGE